MECVAFHFLNIHVWNIMATFQDDNIKIHPAQIMKEWLWGSWRIIFTHESAPLSPDLKFPGSLWDVLEETLQRNGLLLWQYKIFSKNWWKSHHNNFYQITPSLLFFMKSSSESPLLEIKVHMNDELLNASI